MSTATTLRNKFTTMMNTADIETLSHALIQIDTNSEVGMMIRLEIIKTIEARFPEIEEWVENFYALDGEPTPAWDMDYADVVMLARAALSD